ncbi:MAG TPA: hypothetical protein VIV66_13110 [Pyrinomonadaceae bacterium]
MAIGWYEKIKHGIRYWLLRRLPTCKSTVEVISQSFERRLGLRERVMLKVHLWVCIWCVWYLEHLQTMRTTLRAKVEESADFPNSPTLSDEARERMKRALGGS